MTFSEALTATWLDDFLGIFTLGYFKVKVKKRCGGHGFSQKKNGGWQYGAGAGLFNPNKAGLFERSFF